MFSVVIPVYNHKNYVIDALISSLRSRLVTEILVRDDGSTDLSPKVLEIISKPWKGRVKNLTLTDHSNCGAHSCLNALVEAASNDWIAVLNSDDFFVPGRFEFMERFSRNKKYNFVFGELVLIDEEYHVIGQKRGPLDPEYPFPNEFDAAKMMKEGHWLPLLANQNYIATTGNMIFTKELFFKVGGFRPYRYVHDWDFALRALSLGRPFFISKPLTTYRLHGSNTIKEENNRVNIEVKDLFKRFSECFPEVVQKENFKIGLEGNLHLNGEKTI